MNTFEDYKKSITPTQQEKINDALISACQHGILEEIKEFLTSPNLDMHANILASKGSRRNYNLKFPLSIACKDGHLDVIKYLLTSSDLKNHADIKQSNYFAVFEACLYGHLDIVKYFLTSSDLNDKPNIHIIDYNGDNETLLDIACTRARIDIVKFLLTSTELEDHPDIHRNNDNGFIMAATYNTDNHIELVKYLIFDYKIEKTKNIINYLKKNPDKEIEQWFNMRDLNQNLNKELDNNIVISKKMKV